MTADFCKALRNDFRVIEKKNELTVALNLTEEVESRIFSLTALVKKGECRIENGELFYGGTVSFNAVFMAEEMNRVEVGAKFTFKTTFEGEADGCTARYHLSDVKLKREGGMLYATCELQSTITLIKTREIDFISSLDTLTKEGSARLFERSRFEKEFSVDDEFSTKRVKRALSSEAVAIVTAVSCETDFLTVDGEVILNVCLLPFSENSDILKETRIIPFRFEIDADGADEGGEASVKAFAEKISLKIFVDENSGKTTVTANVSVRVEGYYYTPTDQKYVIDAYSPEFEIALKKEVIVDSSIASFESGSERVNGRAVCKVPEYSRLVKLVGERIDDCFYRRENGATVIEGVIVGDVIFADSDNALVSESLKMPFGFTAPIEGEIEDLSVVIEGAAAKIRSGEIECDVTLRYSLAKIASYKTEVITSAEKAADKPVNDSAISVYVGRRGDEEWDVIKRLGVSPDKIYELNGDISFPLSGGEKIAVFRKR
ncbi:MAG: DUF3794 domain-containing protein [Clostridia bacterium]|nr:DUF3794 domain-containing protein [Clostridia bacterium]